MIDPPIWQTKMLPRFFLKIQHAHGQKMIEPPRYVRPGSLLEFFLNIQHAHVQKMIDPPGMTDQDLS